MTTKRRRIMTHCDPETWDALHTLARAQRRGVAAVAGEFLDELRPVLGAMTKVAEAVRDQNMNAALAAASELEGTTFARLAEAKGQLALAVDQYGKRGGGRPQGAPTLPTRSRKR